MKKNQQTTKKLSNQLEKTDKKNYQCDQQSLKMQQQQSDLFKQQEMLSDLHEEYLKMFDGFKIPQQSIFKPPNNANLKLANQFQENAKINIIQYDLESIVILIHYGNFVLKISVLLTNLGNEFYSQNVINGGSFGMVYLVKFKQQKYALKQIQLKDQQSNLQSDLQQIYKQYLLSVIASQLKIGPKIQNFFGYDIVVTQRNAMFLMQYCEQIKTNDYQLVESQLFSCLAIMHSIKFLHMDIKPQNIAYSILLQKHIFLDFGVSKLIKQNVGYKSLTAFAGTFSYCSEQMKMSYILMKKIQVDLYFNDAHCLKKTLNRIKYHQIMSSKQKTQKEDDTHKTSNYLVGYQYDCVDMFSEAIEIFKLKFEIYKGNLVNILKICHQMKSMPLTTLQLLSNENIDNQIKQNYLIIEIMQQTKKNLKLLSFKSSVCDQILSNYFKFSDSDKIRTKLSVSQVLSLKQEHFEEIIQSTQEVNKIFQYFNPFSLYNLKHQKNNKNFYKINRMKIKIIQKICNAKQKDQSQFLYEKVRFVLIFFFNKLSELKSLHILQSLRYLFICIGDWPFMEKVEQQILELIQQPSQILLKTAEIYLFWKVIHQNLKSSKISMIQSALKKAKNKQNRNNQIYLSSQCLLGLIAKQLKVLQQEQQIQIKLKIIDVLKKLQEISMSVNIIQQTILNIKYLYYQLNQIEIKQSIVHIGLAQQIYLQNLSIQNYVPIPQNRNYKQVKTTFYSLSSLFYEVANEKGIPINSYISDIVSILFQVYEKNAELISQSFWYISQNYIAADKNKLIQVVNKYIQNSVITSISQKQNKEALNQHIVFSNIRFIIYVFRMIQNHYIFSSPQQCLKQQELDFVIQKLESLLNTLKALIIIESQIKKPLSDILVQIGQLFFYIFKVNQISKLQEKLLFFLNKMQPYLECDKKSLSLFIQLLFFIEKRRLIGKELYTLTIKSIVQQFWKQKRFYIFEMQKNLILQYININSEIKQHNLSFCLLLDFVEYLKFNKKGDNLFSKNDFILIVVGNFSNVTPIQILLHKYTQISSTKKQCQGGIYLCFVFYIFLSVCYFLNRQQKRKQIIRTSLNLYKVSFALKTKIESFIYSSALQFQYYSTQRKKIRLLKLETYKNQLKSKKKFIQEAHFRVGKMKNKLIMNILSQKFVRMENNFT